MAWQVQFHVISVCNDSRLQVSGKDVRSIELSGSSEMDSRGKWLESNKLSLHLGKTKSILVAPEKKLEVSELGITLHM